MLPRGLFLTLLLVLFPTYCLADTKLLIFLDNACANSGTVITFTSAGNSTGCYIYSEDNIHSFGLEYLDPNCQVIAYTDRKCGSKQTVASLDRCVYIDTFGSYELSCGNFKPSASDSASVTSTSTRSATGSSQSLTSSVTTSTSVSQSLASSASTAPASAPSSGGGKINNDNGNGGLGTTGTIAVSVILPSVSIIVAIIFGVRAWNSGHYPRKKEGFAEIPMENQSATAKPPDSAAQLDYMYANPIPQIDDTSSPRVQTKADKWGKSPVDSQASTFWGRSPVAHRADTFPSLPPGVVELPSGSDGSRAPAPGDLPELPSSNSRTNTGIGR